jgi:hypothetical protein
MHTNHANQPRRRGKTLAAAALVAAVLGIGTAVAGTTTDEPGAGEWDRCVLVSKDILWDGGVHDAFLC